MEQAMPPPPPGPSRSKALATRGRETQRNVKVRGRRVSGGGGRPGLRLVLYLMKTIADRQRLCCLFRALRLRFS